jgi:hypothetical protein
MNAFVVNRLNSRAVRAHARYSVWDNHQNALAVSQDRQCADLSFEDAFKIADDLNQPNKQPKRFGSGHACWMGGRSQPTSRLNDPRRSAFDHGKIGGGFFCFAKGVELRSLTADDTWLNSFTSRPARSS